MTQAPDPDMTQHAPADVRQLRRWPCLRPAGLHAPSPDWGGPPQPGCIPPAPPVPAGYGYELGRTIRLPVMGPPPGLSCWGPDHFLYAILPSQSTWGFADGIGRLP
jgi:hypothetical protein